jgi:hypothetical protein
MLVTEANVQHMSSSFVVVCGVVLARSDDTEGDSMATLITEGLLSALSLEGVDEPSSIGVIVDAETLKDALSSFAVALPVCMMM